MVIPQTLEPTLCDGLEEEYMGSQDGWNGGRGACLTLAGAY